MIADASLPVSLDFSAHDEIITDFEDIGIKLLPEAGSSERGALAISTVDVQRLIEDTAVELPNKVYTELLALRPGDFLVSVSGWKVPNGYSPEKVDRKLSRMCRKMRKSKGQVEIVFQRSTRVKKKSCDGLTTVKWTSADGSVNRRIIKRPRVFSKTWFLNNLLGEKLNTTKRFDSNKKVWAIIRDDLYPELEEHGFVLTNIIFCDESNVYVTLSREYFLTFVSSSSEYFGMQDNFSNFSKSSSGSIDSLLFVRLFKVKICDISFFQNSHLLSFDYNYATQSVDSMKHMRNRRCHHWDFSLFEELNPALITHFFRVEHKFFNNPFLIFGSKILLAMDPDRFFQERKLNIRREGSEFSYASTSLSTDNGLFYFLRQVFYKMHQAPVAKISNASQTGQTIILHSLLNGAAESLLDTVVTYILSLEFALRNRLDDEASPAALSISRLSTSAESQANYMASRLFRKRATEVFDDFDREYVTTQAHTLKKVKVLRAVDVLSKAFLCNEVVLEVKNGKHCSFRSRNVCCCSKLLRLWFKGDDIELVSAEVILLGMNLNPLTRSLSKPKKLSRRRYFRNFDIFYELLADYSVSPASLNQNFTEMNFRILSSKKNSDKLPIREKVSRGFNTVTDALKLVGFSNSEVETIKIVLLVILHLGNVELEKIGTGENSSFSFKDDTLSQDTFRNLSALLGLEQDDIKETIADLNFYRVGKKFLEQTIKIFYSKIVTSVFDMVNNSVSVNEKEKNPSLELFNFPGVFDIDLFSRKDTDIQSFFDFFLHENIINRLASDLCCGDSKESLPVISSQLSESDFLRLNVSKGLIEASFINFQYMNCMQLPFTKRNIPEEQQWSRFQEELPLTPLLTTKKEKNLFAVKHFNNYAHDFVSDSDDLIMKYKRGECFLLPESEKFTSYVNKFLKKIKNTELRKFLGVSLSEKETLSQGAETLIKFLKQKRDCYYVMSLSSSRNGHRRKEVFQGERVSAQIALVGLSKLMEFHSYRGFPVARSLQFIVDFIYIHGLLPREVFVAEAGIVRAIRCSSARNKKISFNVVVQLCRRLLEGVFGLNSEGSEWMIKKEIISVQASKNSANSMSSGRSSQLSRETYILYFTKASWEVLVKTRLRVRERAALVIQSKLNVVVIRITAIKKLQRFVRDIVLAPFKNFRAASKIVSIYYSMKIRKDVVQVKKATIIIQSFFRKVKAKCSESNKLNGLSLLIKIQSCWRRYITQRKFTLLMNCRKNRKRFLNLDEMVLINSLVIKLSDDVFGAADEDVYELLLTNKKRLLLINVHTGALVGQVGRSVAADGDTTAVSLFCEQISVSKDQVSAEKINLSGNSALKGFRVNAEYIFCDILNPDGADKWLDLINQLSSKRSVELELESLVTLRFPKLLELFCQSVLIYKIGLKQSRNHNMMWQERLVVLHNSKIYWAKNIIRRKRVDGTLMDTQSQDSGSDLYGGSLNTSFSSGEILFESASDLYKHNTRQKSFRRSKLKMGFSKKLPTNPLGRPLKSQKAKSLMKKYLKGNLISSLPVTPDTELEKGSVNPEQLPVNANLIEIFSSISNRKEERIAIQCYNATERNSFAFYIEMNVALEKRAFISGFPIPKSQGRVSDAFQVGLSFIPRNETAAKIYETLEIWKTLKSKPKRFFFIQGLYHQIGSDEYIENNSPHFYHSIDRFNKFIKSQRKRLVRERKKADLLRKWRRAKTKIMESVNKEAFQLFLLEHKVSRSTLKSIRKHNMLSPAALSNISDVKLEELGVNKERSRERLRQAVSEFVGKKATSETLEKTSKDTNTFDHRIVTVLKEIRKPHLVDRLKFKQIISLAQAKQLSDADYALMGIQDTKEIGLLRNSFCGFDESSGETAHQILKALLVNIDLFPYYQKFINAEFGNISTLSQFTAPQLKAKFDLKNEEDAELILQGVKHYSSFFGKHKQPSILEGRRTLLWPDRLRWTCPNCHKNSSTEFDNCMNCGFYNSREFNTRQKAEILWLCRRCKRWNSIRNDCCENRSCKSPKPKAHLTTKNISKWYSKRSYVRFFDKHESMHQFERLKTDDEKAKMRRSLYQKGDIVRYVNLVGALEHKGVKFSAFGFIAKVLEEERSYAVVFEVEPSEDKKAGKSHDSIDTVEIIVPHRDIEVVPQDLVNSDTDISSLDGE